MATAQSAKLSPIKRFAGLLALAAIIVISLSIGRWLGPRHSEPVITSDPVFIIIFIVLGAFLFLIGVATYVTVLLTRCFTFNFRAPYFRGYRTKLWFCNLLVGLFLQCGFACMMLPTIANVLDRFFPPQVVYPLSFFIPFIISQIVLIWFQLWAPLEMSLIRRRLAACGISAGQLASGNFVGISDPSRNSFKKMTLVEEDMGMLWLGGGRLAYRGDTQGFDIGRQQLLDVQQQADAGSVSAYFGAAHVIITFTQSDGSQRRVRLHSEGDWTMTAKARALNQLADQLNAWRASTASVPAAVPKDA